MFDALFFITIDAILAWNFPEPQIAKNITNFIKTQYNNYKDSNDDKTKTTL